VLQRVLIVHQTRKALLITDGTQDVWVARSQVEIVGSGRYVTVRLPSWLAARTGLAYLDPE